MHLSIKALAKQTTIYGLFQIIQRAVGFAVIPFYSHHLTPREFGSLDILYLVVWFIGIIGGSKLDAAFIRYYTVAKANNTVPDLISSSVVGLTAFATLFCTTAALAATPLLEFMYSSKDIPLSGFYLALLATWLELLGSLPLAYLRTNQDARLAGSLSLSRALIGTLVGVMCVAMLGMGIRGILLGAAVGGLILVVSGYWIVLRREPLRLKASYALTLYRYALPMLPAPIFMYLLTYADRFFLAKYWSLEEVGLYAMGYKFAMLTNLLIMGPFGEMWGTNQFALFEAGKKRTYRRIALLYVSLLHLAALCITYGSYEITVVAFAKSFQGLLAFVAPLTVGVAIWGIVPTLDFGCLVRNKTWLRSFTTGAAALINIVLNFLLIMRFGAMGAALATLLSFAFLTMLTYSVNRLLTDYCVDFRKASVASLALMGLAALVYLGPVLPYPLFLLIRLTALAGFAFLLMQLNGVGIGQACRYVSNKFVISR